MGTLARNLPVAGQMSCLAGRRGLSWLELGQPGGEKWARERRRIEKLSQDQKDDGQKSRLGSTWRILVQALELCRVEAGIYKLSCLPYRPGQILCLVIVLVCSFLRIYFAQCQLTKVALWGRWFLPLAHQCQSWSRFHHTQNFPGLSIKSLHQGTGEGNRACEVHFPVLRQVDLCQNHSQQLFI